MKRDYFKLIKRLESAAKTPSVIMEVLGEFEAGDKNYPLILMYIGAPGSGRKNVAISAGIHGDEPAGVEAAVRFIENNSGSSQLLENFHFTIFPCDNPSGL